MKLSDEITSVPFVGFEYAKRLRKLEIKTIYDLLLHLPRKYVDFRYTTQIKNVKVGDTVTIVGQITSILNLRTKKGKLMQLATLSDSVNNINIIWFNQYYLINALPVGTEVSVSGKISFWNKKLVIFSPSYEKLNLKGTKIHTGGLIPIYPETEGVSSKWLRSRINYLLKNIDNLIPEDFLQEDSLKEYKLMDLPSAVTKVHKPKDPDEAETARQRLAFNEVLEVQLSNNLKKIEWERTSKSQKIKFDKKDVNDFINNLPFELTKSQIRSIEEIAQDLIKKPPMNRLLEGDVGSGKTVVAAFGAYISFINGYQTIFMAPTQILAEQHYQTLSSLLSKFKMRISLKTGTKTLSDKGRADLIIGTTALLNTRILFDKVALSIVDEQHRFGVKQRAKFASVSQKANYFPNILTMTATPIPRSIALTLYGDLDLSTLDELPAGRQKISTWIVPDKKRKGAYEWIKNKVDKDKAQVYIVCPLIDESDDETMAYAKAVKVEFEKLKNIFPTLKLDLLHGKLKQSQKDKVLKNYRAGKTQILVSTPVIEVGIDVPNASIIMIESAERFGLAQLHQLRGRVGRGDVKSYCILMTSSKSEKVTQRLDALKTAKSGMELAEIDLKIRGAGEIFGIKQHGVGDLKIATWQDVDLIKKSRKLSKEIVDDPQKHKKILDYFKSKQIAEN